MTVLAARTGLPVRAVRVAGVAVPVAAASVVAVLASLVLVSRARAWGLPAVAELPVDAVVGLAYPLTAVLVLSGRRAAGLGRLLLAVGVAGALTALATAVAATADSPGGLATAAVWLQGWLWVGAFFPLLTLLPLLYPDGAPPSPRWRPLVATSLAGMALVAAATALHPEVFQGRVDIAKPLTAQPVAQVLGVAGAALLAPSVLGCVAALAVRLRRSQGLARRQLLVFLAAAGVLLVEALAHNALPEAVSSVSQPVAVALLPLAVGVAVTRHRLYDLDVAVLRALVALSLAGCLAGAYLTAFALARAAVPGSTAVATALAAGLTGLAVQPLAVRLARSADRLYYGDRAEPYTALRGFAEGLRAGATVDEVPVAVCRAVVDTLRLSSAELLLDGDRSVAAVGTPAGPVEELPLEHRGEQVARLRVGLRAGERVLDDRDRALLQALADQAAPAVASLRLYDALRASREALVTSREEERRRLRRDLHDGVGAALAGARLQLESARDRVDDPLAVGMLDAAGAAVAEAVDDVRRLTEDLRPPALDELGLAGSLVALAARVRTPRLDVTTDLDVPPGLPAAVEVAVHRIAAEALTNAARHSGARTVEVALRPDGRSLLLQVTDDGQGIATGRRGVGLDSMRQRAEELGGRLEVRTSERGTAVRAVLPADPGTGTA